MSSKSAWKGEQADPKGVIGVCLENENEVEPIPERNPVEEMKKEMMREELNDSPSILRGGKRSRSPSEVSEPVNPQPKEDQPNKSNSTVGNDLQGENGNLTIRPRLHWQTTCT